MKWFLKTSRLAVQIRPDDERCSAARYIAVASFSRGNGKEPMRVAARIGVLANDDSAGVYADRDGTDGVEWRRARNVKR